MPTRRASGPSMGRDAGASDDRSLWKLRALTAGSLVLLSFVAVAAYSSSARTLEPVTRPVEANWVSVERSRPELESMVTVEVSRDITPPLFVAVSGGFVTDVFIEAGEELHPGSSLLAIDGRTLIGYGSEKPLVRDLRQGDRGDDVTVVQELLRAAGHRETPPDGRFDRDTALQVDRLRQASGWPDGQVFPRDMAVWLPEVPYVVGSVNTVRGARPPATHEPLVAGLPRVTDVRISPALPGGSVGELRFAQGRLPLRSGTVDPDELSRLLGTGPNSGTLDATAATRPASELWLLPATSIVTDISGQPCAIVRRVGSGEREAIALEVMGGESGVVFVQPGTRDDVEVLANPSQVSSEVATCE